MFQDEIYFWANCVALEIPERIQATYVQQSSYWLTYFPMRGFLAVFDLAQLLSLVLVFIKTQYVGSFVRDMPTDRILACLDAPRAISESGPSLPSLISQFTSKLM